MKTTWFVLALLGLAAIMMIGCTFSISALAETKGSAFLRGLKLADLTGQASAGVKWTIITDMVHERFPDAARSERVARRIVATATMSEANQANFIGQFQSAASAALNSHGAMIKGIFNANQSSTEVVGGASIRSDLQMPRRFYSIGDLHGVADIWCVGVAGRVTVIVSLIEGS